MADRIKGITIEIGGNTVKLQDSLQSVNKSIRQTQSELRDVDRLLKFDPTNTDLLKQKQQLFKDAIRETEAKLQEEKNALKALQENPLANTTEEQKALTREIEATEQQLIKLKDGYRDFGGVASAKLQTAGKDIKEFGNKVSSVGDTLTTKVTLPLAALGGASVAAYSSFSESMAKVSTIAGGTSEDMKAMEDSIISVADTYGVSASDIANATYNAISAGQEAGDAVNFVTASIKTSKAGFTDIGTSVDTLTTIMNAFGESAGTAVEISDKLLTTQNLGKTTFAELGTSIGKVIPTAAMYGVNLDNLAAAYVTTTKNGIATAESTTYINGMLNELGKTGSKASDILKQRTGKSFAELMKSGASLDDVLAELTDEAKKTGVSIGDMFSSQEAGKAAATLTQHADDFTSALNAMGESAGTTQAAYETMADTTAQKMAILKTKMQDTGIKIGAALAPSLERILDSIGALIDKFNALDEGTQETIVKFGMFAIAAGPVLSVVGRMTSGFGSLVGGLGKVVGLFGSASTAIGGSSTALALLGSAATPVIAALGGVGAALGTVYWGMTKTDYMTREQIAAIGGLDAAELELIDTVNEHAKSYETLKASSDVAFAEMSATYEQEKKDAKALVKQLQAITDEQGNIKTGYEKRAETIVGTLADAYGVEIDIIDGQIMQYDELNSKVETVIESKKAEAALTAYQEEYTEALKNQNIAFKELIDAQTVQAEKQRELAELQDLMAGATQTATGAYEYQGRVYDDMNSLLFNESGGLIQNTYDAAKAEAALASDVQAANDAVYAANKTYYDGQATIANYGSVTSAVANGDIKAMQDAVDNLSNHFITAEVGNRDSLTRQVADIQQQYDEMLEAWRAGDQSITQVDLIEKYKLLQQAKWQLDEYVNTNKTSGKDAGAGLVDEYQIGIVAGSARASIAADDMALRAARKAKEESTTGGRTAGTNLTTTYGQAIRAGSVSAVSATNALASNVISSMDVQSSAYSKGMYASQGFANGISAGAYSVYNAAVALAAQVDLGIRTRLDEHSPSKVTEEDGLNGTKGFVNGLLKDKADVFSAGESVGGAAVSGIESVQMPIMSIPGSGIMGSSTIGGGSGNTVNITVYGAEGQDVGTLADIVADRINDAVVSKQRVFA